MSSSSAVSAFVPKLRRATWRYPEWWVLTICAAAWAATIAGMGHNHVRGGFAGVRPQLLSWMGMTVAMMLPAMVSQVRWVAQRSFWGRRHRAIGGFLAGYLLPWSVAGCFAALLLLSHTMHHPAVPAALFLVAAAWQYSSYYHSARRLCHRTVPLAPQGWRADRDCVGYGALVGTECVRACFPLMLACAATGHGIVAMVGGCWLALRDSWWPRPSQRTLLAGTLALALFYGVSGLLAPPAAHAGMRM